MDNVRVGNVLWPVPDLAAALEFYRDVVGLPMKFTDGERFAALDAGGTTLALVAGAEDVTGGTPAISVLVTDLPAAVERLTAGGATVVVPAAEGPHEIRAVLRDPSGQLLVVYAKR